MYHSANRPWTSPTTRMNICNIFISGVNINDELHVATARDLRICNGQIRELVVGRLNHEIAGKLVDSINILRESYIGELIAKTSSILIYSH